MGRLPKDPKLRQRRNKSALKATLSLGEGARKRAPSLPTRGSGEDGKPLDWHRMTRAFWRSVWHSPMAAEYLEADVQGLFRLAVLIDQFWRGPSKELEAQINRSQQNFGLSPLDRRRLEWSVEQVEQVKERRQLRQGQSPAPNAVDDPRKLFSVV